MNSSPPPEASSSASDRLSTASCASLITSSIASRRSLLQISPRYTGPSPGGVAQWLERRTHNPQVGGSNPPAATEGSSRVGGQNRDALRCLGSGLSPSFFALSHEDRTHMATGIRVGITLACTECRRRNYQTNKSKRNTPDRVELSKYCRWCGRHTPHRETR